MSSECQCWRSQVSVYRAYQLQRRHHGWVRIHRVQFDEEGQSLFVHIIHLLGVQEGSATKTAATTLECYTCTLRLHWLASYLRNASLHRVKNGGMLGSNVSFSNSRTLVLMLLQFPPCSVHRQAIRPVTGGYKEW